MDDDAPVRAQRRISVVLDCEQDVDLRTGRVARDARGGAAGGEGLDRHFAAISARLSVVDPVERKIVTVGIARASGGEFTVRFDEIKL